MKSTWSILSQSKGCVFAYVRLARRFVGLENIYMHPTGVCIYVCIYAYPCCKTCHVSYGQLETSMLFLKANFPARNLNLQSLVSDSITHKWEFKSFGVPKVRSACNVAHAMEMLEISARDNSALLLQVIVDLNAFPENGNEPIWQEEICALYRRYHCIDVCAISDARVQGLDPIIYNTRSMWTASATRIRLA